jgi:hypothetical protein
VSGAPGEHHPLGERTGVVAAVFFDFAGAFDSVLPSHVLDSLMSIGIHGPLLKYFQSFLSPRPFQVRIGNTTSPTFLSHRGTPQGSKLSPILFLIVIDGVSRLIPPSIRISLYADDLAVYTHTKDTGQAHTLLQTFINRLVREAEGQPRSCRRKAAQRAISLIFKEWWSHLLPFHQ